MAILKVKDLVLTDFIALVHEYHALANQHFQLSPLLLAFSPAQALFKTFAFWDQAFFEATDQGCIFSPEGELKWRRTADLMRVVYLGDEPPPEGLEDRSTELADLRRHNSDFVLWGKRSDIKDEWIEQQVPHRFKYPIATAEFPRGRVAISVESWIDVFGCAQFGRYHSLKEIIGENHAEG